MRIALDRQQTLGKPDRFRFFRRLGTYRNSQERRHQGQNAECSFFALLCSLRKMVVLHS